MKQPQIDRLYNKLTAQEQATLAFESLACQRYHEFESISGSVQRKLYELPHIDYITRMQGLMQLAGCYGICYWKTACHMAILAALDDDSDRLHDASLRYRNKLTAMNAALNAVCEQLNVMPETIHHFAECSDYKLGIDGDVDEQLFDEYSDLFLKVSYAEN